MNLHNALLFWGDALQISYNMQRSAATKNLSSAIECVCSAIEQQIAKEERDAHYKKIKK